MKGTEHEASVREGGKNWAMPWKIDPQGKMNKRKRPHVFPFFTVLSLILTADFSFFGTCSQNDIRRCIPVSSFQLRFYQGDEHFHTDMADNWLVF